MGNRIKFTCLLFVFLEAAFFIIPHLFAADLMIASFEKDGSSDMGTAIGTWSSNTLDTTQGCKMKIVSTYGVMGRATEDTQVLALTYDVSTTGPAMNGFYVNLNNLDLTPYDGMNILIKGAPGKKFTSRFKIELINEKGERVTHVVTGVTDEWQQISIPMSALKASGSMKDWTKMKKFIIAFDDMTVDSKEGTLYIDEIKFSSSKP